MEEFDKIAIKKDKEDTDESRKEKVLDWLWGDEKKTILGLLKGKQKKKQIQDEK